MDDIYLFFDAGAGDVSPFRVAIASVNTVRIAPLLAVAPALDFTLTLFAM